MSEITYMVEMYDGSVKVLRLPDTSQLTLGPITPRPVGTAPKKGVTKWDEPPEFKAWMLRVYADSSKKKLRACFPNVRSFWEQSFALLEEGDCWQNINMGVPEGESNDNEENEDVR